MHDKELDWSKPLDMADAPPKSYKVELILALVTAVTAIMVAVVSNWDKLNIKPKDDFTDSPSVPKQDDSKPVFRYYNMMLEGANSANDYVANGWEVVYFRFSTIQPDSYSVLDEPLDKGYTYEFELLSTSPDINFKAQPLPSDTSIALPSFFLNSRVTGVLEVEDDVTHLRLMAPDQKYPVTYTLLISCKKT